MSMSSNNGFIVDTKKLRNAAKQAISSRESTEELSMLSLSLLTNPLEQEQPVVEPQSLLPLGTSSGEFFRTDLNELCQSFVESKPYAMCVGAVDLERLDVLGIYHNNPSVVLVYSSILLKMTRRTFKYTELHHVEHLLLGKSSKSQKRQEVREALVRTNGSFCFSMRVPGTEIIVVMHTDNTPNHGLCWCDMHEFCKQTKALLA